MSLKVREIGARHTRAMPLTNVLIDYLCASPRNFSFRISRPHVRESRMRCERSPTTSDGAAAGVRPVQKWAFFKLYLSDTPACAIFRSFVPLVCGGRQRKGAAVEWEGQGETERGRVSCGAGAAVVVLVAAVVVDAGESLVMRECVPRS